ncbi:hypothetical protein F4808DRAFT_427394 [Astrocystis sublimbata]|nr:hypothetical protein F4808DRAFT_446445 [Astrocystis sublimbata]KAI0200965.1 hypothetical protein F4808DRAFT_427394 [Astrocystis sublimbata]
MASRGNPARGAGRPQPPAKSTMRLISVDSILQHVSDIPSGQPRTPPPRGPRTISGVRRVSGGGLPNLASRTGQHNMPSRTTRVSEKLVLLPETPDEPETDDAEESLLVEEEDRPLKDEERDVLRKRGGLRGKSYAERLPKLERAEKLSRLSAYCTAQSYKMKATSEFLRKKHDAKTKLYDDCLYTVYHTPLLPGVEGYRVRSRPILKSPGTGKTVLDLEIERSEQRDEHMGYYDEYGSSPRDGDGPHRQYPDGSAASTEHNHSGNRQTGPVNGLTANAQEFAEVFVFSYGVVVFWNFTEQQEKAILADITFAESETGGSLVTRPLEQSDFETEEFHFEYNNDVKRPRIFNDMITLLPRSDHMVRLTISHAIAQSTKLCFFEERMSETLADAQHVPKRLASTGQLNMSRTEIVKILGRLFKSRVDINLSSNILDVPNFFWDAEPTLHPLYVAIREYLEIDPRTKVLNERCRVFLDLAAILSDSVADSKMSAITWIVIILIIVSIMVTVTEVVLRFTILSKERGNNSPEMGAPETGVIGGLPSIMARSNYTLQELRTWGASLSEQEKRAICGADFIGSTYAGI